MAQPLAVGATAPALEFSVDGAGPLRHAAAPAIALCLRVASPQVPIRSLVLTSQVRIAATQRAYSERERERLAELFGGAGDWGRGLRSLLWANVTTLVPPFTQEATVELPVPCSYDLEVTAARYLEALGDGAVPLELLFSGTAFYADAQGALRTALIPSQAEASYRLPVAVWRETLDRHFPHSAWLRVDRDVFDRLADFRARHGDVTWEGALERLLEREQ